MAIPVAVCDQARTRLISEKVEPRSRLLPRKSPEYYFPIKAIRKVLKSPADGLELKHLFQCSCPRCRRLAAANGRRDNLDDNFSDETEQELLGDYAAIYALLIYINKPGLIHRIRQKGIQLQGTNFLNAGNLSFLFEKGYLSNENEAKGVQDEILEHQYKFLIRKLDTHDEITEISEKETLPIDEDEDPIGKGSFAEVHGFKLHDDDYLGDYFVSRRVGCIDPFRHQSLTCQDQQICTEVVQAVWYERWTTGVVQGKATAKNKTQSSHAYVRRLPTWRYFFYTHGES
jgi:hypothetical protein